MFAMGLQAVKLSSLMASYDERIAPLLDLIGRDAEAALHRVGAARYYAKSGDPSRAAKPSRMISALTRHGAASPFHPPAQPCTGGEPGHRDSQKDKRRWLRQRTCSNRAHRRQPSDERYPRTGSPEHSSRRCPARRRS